MRYKVEPDDRWVFKSTVYIEAWLITDGERRAWAAAKSSARAWAKRRANGRVLHGKTTVAYVYARYREDENSLGRTDAILIASAFILGSGTRVLVNLKA